MTTTLSYASATDRPIRLWPLAVGAALMALAPFSGLLMRFAPSLVDSRHTPGTLDWGHWSEITTVLYRVLLITALGLMTAGLVRRPGKDWLRWYALLNMVLLAALTLAKMAVALTVFVPNPLSAWAGRLWYILWVAWFPVQLAMLGASMVLLVVGAARLGHRFLGIAAALVLVPGAVDPLLWLASLAKLGSLQNFAAFKGTCDKIAFTGGTLVWCAAALATGILAWRRKSLCATAADTRPPSLWADM